MEQVGQILSGERDYKKIYGNTGPLVYPAAHVHIYTGLYHLTDQGKDILTAQKLFGILYMVTLAVVMTCYRQAKVPIEPSSGIYSGGRADSEKFIGPTIRVPDADPLETAA